MKKQNQFLPTTREEMDALGWNSADIILVNGDTYIDSPYSGIAMVGRMLEKAGYRVAIIAQPNCDDTTDISRLGEPRLFWGVSSGTVDSMVSNYTALKKPRKMDDFTPGGVNNRRPDRAVMVYTNLIRRAFKNTRPIVLGGIEASLRRVAHYDYWSNKIRGSILIDAKADYLLYGMADRTIVHLADALRDGKPVEQIRGVCYITREAPAAGLRLPSAEECKTSLAQFETMFRAFYENCDPVTGRILIQPHLDRFLVQNPPARNRSSMELDEVYTLPFTREVHPFYTAQGAVKAQETIRFSVATHRGCYGECNFCAIAVHEGRTVQYRSESSILAEIVRITQLPDFKGYITDLSGPTANMYGFECSRKLEKGACKNKRCLYPSPCTMLNIDHSPLISLMKKARKIPGVKKVFASSGIRYDMIQSDHMNGREYLREVCAHHVSGQLKIAPEHDSPKVLELMGKPGKNSLLQFKKDFDQMNEQNRADGKKYFLSYYFIAAHPGCTMKDMMGLKQFAKGQLRLAPEQTQIFTPTPSTWSTLMYITEKDPFREEHIFVEKDPLGKQKQKDVLIEKEKKPKWEKHF